MQSFKIFKNFYFPVFDTESPKNTYSQVTIAAPVTIGLSAKVKGSEGPVVGTILTYRDHVGRALSECEAAPSKKLTTRFLGRPVPAAGC